MIRLPFFPEPPRLPIESVGAEALQPDPGCARCALGEQAHTRCVPPAVVRRGEGLPTLLVVGESPGAAEDKSGRPFMGQAGVYVRRLVERLWSGNVVYAHAVACFPGNKRAQPSHVEACRPYLRGVDADLRPARVLALGALAARSVFGRALPPLSVRKAYGHTSDGRLAFALIHPAATFRNRFVRGWFEEDLRWALESAPPAAPVDGVAAVVETVEDARAAAASLRAGAASDSPCGVDVETYGAPGDSDFRVLTAGASAGGGVSYVWDEGYAGELLGSELLDPLVALLVDPAVPKTAHNAKYDWNAFALAHGVRVRGLRCCTLLHRKLDQADAAADLETVQVLVGMAGWKDAGAEASDVAEAALRKAVAVREKEREQEERAAATSLQAARAPEVALTRYRSAAERARAGWVGHAVDFDNAVSRVVSGRASGYYAKAGMPRDVRARYCGQDAYSTHVLAGWLIPRVESEPGLRMVWEEVQAPFHRAVEAMEQNGLLIDMVAVRELQAYMADRIEQLSVYFLQAGLGNPNSSKDVVGWLRGMKAKLGPPGKSGLPSVDASVLEELEKHGRPYSEGCGRLLQYRRATKFKSTYADSFGEHVRDDGHIHTSIRMEGTETMRPSSSDPNMLNIPRPKEQRDGSNDGKLCRDMIVAPDGCLILEADQSQIELRMAGKMSGDELMLDLFARDVDFHLETARMIAPLFKVDTAEVGKDHWLRDAAKTVNFATLYGDPPAGLAFKLGCDVRTAEKLQAAILGKFRKLAAWIRARERESTRSGSCRTVWRGLPAHRRPLWQIADADEEARKTARRSSYNTPVQGSSALITNASCGAMQRWLDETGFPAWLVLTVYDSQVYYVTRGYEYDLAEQVERVSTQWDRDLLRVDIKVGPAWGSMTKLGVRPAAPGA